MAADPDRVAGEWCKRVIRGEMARRGLSYEDLAHRLVMVADPIDQHPLRNKVARASFSAAFFVQCLAAMECKTLDIDLLTIWRESRAEELLSGEDSDDQGEK